jgi:subtilisin family serine protease
MIGLNEGATLQAANPPDASTTAIFQEFVTSNRDVLAGFSSQGPTKPDTLIKPDATSVGVNVLSSITCVGKGAGCPGDGSGWAFFSGTSMATPHFAGSSAVLLQLHPDWSSAQVKSALVNTSDRVIQDAKTGAMDVGPMAQGAGRENLSSAAKATIFFEPDSASFGKVSSSNVPAPFTFVLSNTTKTDQTFLLAAQQFTPSANPALIPFDAGTTTPGDSRMSFPGSVTVPANSSTTLTVSVNPGLPSGTVVQGWITLTGGSGGPYHFAYYAVVP